jgi:hypothetical protein
MDQTQKATVNQVIGLLQSLLGQGSGSNNAGQAV